MVVTAETRKDLVQSMESAEMVVTVVEVALAPFMTEKQAPMVLQVKIVDIIG